MASASSATKFVGARRARLTGVVTRHANDVVVARANALCDAIEANTSVTAASERIVMNGVRAAAKWRRKTWTFPMCCQLGVVARDFSIQGAAEERAWSLRYPERLRSTR